MLCAFNDDYIDSKFAAEVQCRHSLNNVRIDICFHLENAQLQQLIMEGKVSYLVHIESPKTSLRKRFSTGKEKLSVLLNKDDLSDCIEICTFIVANEDIENYHNSSFNALDKNMVVTLSKGNIIAIGTSKEIYIERKSTEARDADSLIKIRRNAKGRAASIYVDTDNQDYIILGIDDSLFNIYNSLGKGRYREATFSLLFLPAMIVILTRMKKDSESAESQLEGKKWYEAIMDLLDKAGYSLENLKEDNDTILEAAQVILKNPIQVAMNALNTDGVEEDNL